ncbi:MAG: stimulus-sensing domain-containing protein [Proteobacteria bacterium]|nr:stimulus-sensing domain-containing protein [Pseudomonadota bacterium]
MFKPRHHDAWYVSPITLRILVVNIGALIILGVGMLYTAQYETELIGSELHALQAEGRLLASALAEGGVRETLSGDPILAEDLSRQMLRKLVESSKLHTLLFSKNGQLMLDSHQLVGPGGMVQIVELDSTFETWSPKKRAYYFLQKILNLFTIRLSLPLYPDKIQGIETYPHLMETLGGENSAGAWRDVDGRIILVAALPVQKLKNVLGAVMLTRAGDNIENAVRGVQLTVIKIFLLVLLGTILLSIYLSKTIATPLLQLAEAAGQVEMSLFLKNSIPNFSSRKDEIGILSTALRHMTEALSDRIDAISNFAADVAHEIKNPLASLKSAVETFPLVKDPDQQARLLLIIKDDVSRLNRLITDISAASRLDSELYRVEKTTFDLAPLLQKIVEMESDSVKIVLQVEKNQRLWVTGNDVQLGQVIYNLVQNATSFLSEKGKITMTGLMQGDKVIIHVDNDGQAIPEKNLEAIFERFYSERPEKEKFGLHSGLGLSISRQIIRAHRGAVFARNLKDAKGQHQGVRFTIILPAEAPPK